MRESESIRSRIRIAPDTKSTAERSYREAVTFNKYIDSAPPDPFAV